MNIKLEQYKIFNEAAITLSFSQAARNLFISQSAVSQTINILEKELDVQLFIRLPRGVELTKEGQMLQRQIADALSIITNAENQLAILKELKTGELRIGTGDAFCKSFLIPYLVKFRERYPDVHIHVKNGTTLETIELVKSGQLDLAFISLPYKDESLNVEELLEVHDIFVSGSPNDHIYTLEEIANENLIMLEKVSNSRRSVERYFSEQGILLKPEMELGGHELVVTFAKNNLGISVVTKEFCLNELKNKELYELTLEKPLPPRHMGYAYATRITLSPAAIQLLTLINQ